MSREFKFRAWDGKKLDTAFNGDEWLGINVNELFKAMIDDDKLVVMQWTGLLDRQGVEIYEGDIIKYRFGYEDVVGRVEYSDNYAGFIDPVNQVMMSMFDPTDGDGLIAQVIGNIYQNGDLLK